MGVQGSNRQDFYEETAEDEDDFRFIEDVV